MQKAMEAHTLEKSCKNMEEPLGDVDAEDLVREVLAAVTAVLVQENISQVYACVVKYAEQYIKNNYMLLSNTVDML